MGVGEEKSLSCQLLDLTGQVLYRVLGAVRGPSPRLTIASFNLAFSALRVPWLVERRPTRPGPLWQGKPRAGAGKAVMGTRRWGTPGSCSGYAKSLMKKVRKPKGCF